MFKVISHGGSNGKADEESGAVSIGFRMKTPEEVRAELAKLSEAELIGRSCPRNVQQSGEALYAVTNCKGSDPKGSRSIGLR